jgi:hypothetical protein
MIERKIRRLWDPIKVQEGMTEMMEKVLNRFHSPTYLLKAIVKLHPKQLKRATFCSNVETIKNLNGPSE